VRFRKTYHETTVRLLLRQAASRIRGVSKSTATPFAHETDANKEFAFDEGSNLGTWIFALIFFIGVALLWRWVAGPGGGL